MVAHSSTDIIVAGGELNINYENKRRFIRNGEPFYCETELRYWYHAGY